MDDLTARTRLGTSGFAPLPAPAPLEMPRQSLSEGSRPVSRLSTTPATIWLRRVVLLVATAALTAAAAREMYVVLQVAGLTLLEALVLGLFVTLFAWIAFAFVTVIPGFFAQFHRGRHDLGIDERTDLPALASRTALLIPIYNEAPDRITTAVEAMHAALVEAGRDEHFDFFILSDTTDPQIWIAEEAAWLSLRHRLSADASIYYRRRPRNIERKAGNIADWVRRFGGAYPHFLILDADSMMTAEAMTRLARAMEDHPGVGLIQTLPVIVNGETLFARMQQFAGRIYGPLIAAGLSWWHGSEGNYWGHNAIIRTRAFAEQAGLPALRGRKPFGGGILSHDFVEAALMRRGGWALHMVPLLPGSYEESPPSLPDLAARDRRWCQGNLQHAAVLPARGLHWVSRLHLLTGIGCYITAPLWLGFLCAGMAIALQAQFLKPEYFGSEASLFPQWPAQDPVRAIWVFGATMAILLLPKVLSLVVAAVRPLLRRGCGGLVRLSLGVLLETLLAGLLAPVVMLSQARAVFEILLGRDSGWQTQRRDDGSIPWGDSVRRYLPHSLLGIAFAAGSYAISMPLALWMSPVSIGLILAVPLVWLTASPKIGRAARRLGVLRIPEEASPPPILIRSNALRGAREVHPVGVEALCTDATLRETHLSMLPPEARRGEPLDPTLVIGLAKLDGAASLAEAQIDLSRAELAAVLASRAGIRRLVALWDARPV